MNKFYFCPLPLLWIWGKTLRITSLTITLNKKTVNVILIMLITVVGVFLTNPVTKRCRRCRAMNIPFGRNKKNLQGKGGQRQQIIVSNFPQMFLWMPLRKVPGFPTKPLLSAKQPNPTIKCRKIKSGEKIGERRVLGNEFFLGSWYLEKNRTICQHSVLRPFRFLELLVFFQNSLPSFHIFTHSHIFPWCTLVAFSRLNSKTSIENKDMIQVPKRDF